MLDLRSINHKKILAGFMSILLFFVVLLSTFYIASEADHDCTGEDCPVCEVIQQCENNLKQLGITVAKVLPTIPIIHLSLTISFQLPVQAGRQSSLISMKIRMNN